MMAEPARRSASVHIRRIVLLAASFMVVLTLIQICSTYPRFIARAVGDCSSKAVRDAVHIKRMLSIKEPLEGQVVPVDVVETYVPVMEEGEAKIRGTGLGLSVSHTIVKDHGGGIGLESRVGEGTVFTISLPFMREGEGEAGGSVTGEGRS